MNFPNTRPLPPRRRLNTFFKGLCSAAAVSTALFTGHSASAQITSSWNKDISDVFTNANDWTNGVPGAANASLTAPTTTTNADTAIFSLSVITATRTITVDTGRNIGNITFDDNTTSTSTTARNYVLAPVANTFIFSAGGTVQTTGTATAGVSFTNAIYASVILEGNYTFATNSSNGTTNNTTALYFGANGNIGTIVPVAGLGTVTLTLSGASGGGGNNGSIYHALKDSSDGTTVTSVLKTGTSAWTLNGANTYSGGTNIQQGTINIGNVAGFGTGTVTLGNATVGGDASVSLGSGYSPTNAITVTGGAGARSLLSGGGTGNGTFAGAITLSNPTAGLTVGDTSGTAGRTSNYTGGITGTGNITVNNTSVGSTVFSTKTINPTGTITNSSTGTGALTQTTGGTLGANVTNFTQSSGTSNTTFSLANTYGTTTVSAGTLLTSGTGTLGTGNVTVNGGALTLGSSVSFADTALLSFAGTTKITLNNTTADTLASIFDTDAGAPTLAPGTYTAAQLDSAFGGITTFTGSGSLTVTTAVPEPATWLGGLMLVGTFGFALRRRRDARPA